MRQEQRDDSATIAGRHRPVPDGLCRIGSATVGRVMGWRYPGTYHQPEHPPVTLRYVILPCCIAALVSLSACDWFLASQPEVEETAGGALAVSNPSVRLNANPAAPSAAYFTLTGGRDDQVLTSVSSPQIERAELHESKMESGMMSMAALTEVPVPADGTVEFRQGGKHVMLFGISDAARAAGRLTLTLAFRDGQTLPVEVRFPAQGAAPLPKGDPSVVVAPSPPVPIKPKLAPTVQPDNPADLPDVPTPAAPPESKADEHAGH